MVRPILAVQSVRTIWPVQPFQVVPIWYTSKSDPEYMYLPGPFDQCKQLVRPTVFDPSDPGNLHGMTYLSNLADLFGLYDLLM